MPVTPNNKVLASSNGRVLTLINKMFSVYCYDTNTIVVLLHNILMNMWIYVYIFRYRYLPALETL